jgi:hypothetical protein
MARIRSGGNIDPASDKLNFCVAPGADAALTQSIRDSGGSNATVRTVAITCGWVTRDAGNYIQSQLQYQAASGQNVIIPGNTWEASAVATQYSDLVPSGTAQIEITGDSAPNPLPRTGA